MWNQLDPSVGVFHQLKLGPRLVEAVTPPETRRECHDAAALDGEEVRLDV